MDYHYRQYRRKQKRRETHFGRLLLISLVLALVLGAAALFALGRLDDVMQIARDTWTGFFR